MDRHTDANRFCNLSHAICYSYGTDNYYTVFLVFIRFTDFSRFLILAECTILHVI